jgi:hypothetical protein
MKKNQTGFNGWWVLGAVGLAVLLCLMVWIILSSSRKQTELPLSPTSVLVVVSAPTLTPLPSPTPYYTPTPTERPGLPPPSGGIQIGSFVQIAGTDGVGLRIRAGAGLNYDSKFLGMDAEVFEVKDGPVEVDGITWWNLVAPYDENRAGWAAANYLQIVNGQP